MSLLWVGMRLRLLYHLPRSSRHDTFFFNLDKPRFNSEKMTCSLGCDYCESLKSSSSFTHLNFPFRENRWVVHERGLDPFYHFYTSTDFAN